MIKLMIVDDEPYILEGLTKMIEGTSSCCSHIAEAADAFEALSKMPDFKPDVVITDLNMPEKDGFELIEEAKEAGYCDRFVVLTGYDEFEYARKAIRARVVEYLLKPINQNEIVALLQKLAGEISGPQSEFAGHMDKMTAYIGTHFNGPLSLDDLAELTGLHPNYISNLFRKERGITFIRYLNNIRIEKAKEFLMNEPSTPVNIIGQRVGFESPQHFLKIFKQYAGVTPGCYKESKSGSN